MRSRLRGFDLRARGIDEEDIEQDARIRLWFALRRDPRVQLPPLYAIRAVTSSAVDAVRRERVRYRLQHEGIDLGETALAHPGPNPETVCARVQWLQHLGRCLARLSNRRRRVVEMVLLGHSLGEAAVANDISLDACTKLAQRGLAQLRELLGERPVLD